MRNLPVLLKIKTEHTAEWEKYLENEWMSFLVKKVFIFLHGTQQNMQLILTLEDYLEKKKLTNVEAFPKASSISHSEKPRELGKPETSLLGLWSCGSWARDVSFRNSNAFLETVTSHIPVTTLSAILQPFFLLCLPPGQAPGLEQIGRASCRERV